MTLKQENTTETPHPRAVELAIRRCQAYFGRTQYPEGYWWGELESNPAMEAEHLMLCYFLGRGDQERWRKVSNFILSKQREDGSWGQYYQAPGDLSTSVECYFALKLGGLSPRLGTNAEGPPVHPVSGRYTQDQGLHQDLAGPLRTVGLEGHSQHATGDDLATPVASLQHL